MSSIPKVMIGFHVTTRRVSKSKPSQRALDLLHGCRSKLCRVCPTIHDRAEMAARISARKTVCRSPGTKPWDKTGKASLGRLPKTAPHVATRILRSLGEKALPSVKRLATWKKKSTWFQTRVRSGKLTNWVWKACKSVIPQSNHAVWCIQRELATHPWHVLEWYHEHPCAGDIPSVDGVLNP